MTQEQVAAEMDWSLSKVIRIETGAVSVSTNDVRGLLNLFRVTDQPEIERIIGLARSARQKPWWYAYRNHLATGYLSYLDLEAGASTLRFYHAAVIPGLLQTESYARAVNRASEPEPVETEQFELEIEVRMRRQRAVLDRDDPPEIMVVLEQATLMRRLGDPAALHDELLQLQRLSARPNVSIRVLPFSAPVAAGIFGSFIILDFGDEAEAPAVYLEGFYNAQQVQSKQQQTLPFLRLFDRFQSVSLTEEESLDLIRRIAAELS